MTKEEAIKIIKDWNLSHAAIEVLSAAIPELKESEDDKIRKELINFIKQEVNSATLNANRLKFKSMLAWIEKQKTTEEALQYLKENHSPSEVSDFQAAMNIAVAKAYNKGYTDGLEKQGEQKPACQLNNLYDNVKFPFKARVKSSGVIVTIRGGQLSADCKEWIKYQSDFEDGYRVYKPDELELVCEVEQKLAEKKELKKIEPKPVEWSDVEKARIDRIIDVLDWAEEKGRISYNDWIDYVGYVKTLHPQSDNNWYKMDNKTQEEIINYLECQKEHEPTRKNTHNRWIAWLEKRGKIIDEYEDKLDRCACESFNKGYKAALEKQGEQKPVNKVEPKFKIGDWILIDNPCKIISIDNYGNYLVRYWDFDTMDKLHTLSREFCESYFHLWTIRDTKDGDVLTCYSDIKGQPIEQTGIMKQYVGRHGGCSNSFKAHFGVDWDNDVVIEGYMGSSNIYPATKEQRDILFQKMKEAGYEWDEEKKELRKIKSGSAWSEDDEKFFKTALWHISYSISNGESTDINCDTTDWLKSIKERMKK